MRLAGKVAVVTGAGSGFGEGIAKLFAEQGASVVIADLNEVAAQRVAKEIGAKALAVRADVTKAADTSAMIDAAIKAFGRLDIVVNNAGTTHRNMPMTEVDEAMFDKIYAVNVKAIYHAAQKVVPIFKENGGGVFLNIASTAGVRPRPGLTWYNGSKGAAITITKSMAVELAPFKIRVNAINPVLGVTGLITEFMGGDDTEERRAKFIATIPLGRLSTPQDIANAALFLVSDEASMVTGVAMEVDGGRCI